MSIFKIGYPQADVATAVAAIHTCRLSDFEIEGSQDRNVSDAGVQKQVLKIGANPLQPQETSASAVIG
jgi:hypothetical protein